MMFSIIVPVYRVEKYLPHCIESVIHQSFGDFELILVNDGSPDNSGEICDDYAEQDSRIHVLHKKNGGVSDARNAGIAIAQGEYIWFLDSDDFLVESALKSVAKLIKKSGLELDMITCAHFNNYNNGNEKLALLPVNNSEVLNKNEYLSLLYNSSGSFWAPWKNIYKRSIIKRINLEFQKGLICAEDFDFFIRFILNGDRFILFNTPTVHYRIDREDSVTNIMSKTAIMDQLIVYSRNYYIFREDGKSIINMQVFLSNKFANTISLLYHLKNKEEIFEVTKYIKDHKWVLNNVKGKKYKIAKLVWTIFGYYKGSKILHTLNRS